VRCRRTYSIVRYSWPQEPRASGSQRVELWHSGLCDNLGGGLCACPTFSILSHLGICGISLEELLLYHLEVYGRRYPSSLCHQYNRTVKSTASTVFSSRLPVRFTGLSGARVQASGGGVPRKSPPTLNHSSRQQHSKHHNTSNHDLGICNSSRDFVRSLVFMYSVFGGYCDEALTNPTLRNAAASFAAIDFPTSHKTLPIQGEYNSRIGRRIATPLLLLHN
jgi:hypothetical protein